VTGGSKPRKSNNNGNFQAFGRRASTMRSKWLASILFARFCRIVEVNGPVGMRIFI